MPEGDSIHKLAARLRPVLEHRRLLGCASATITFGDWQLVGREVTRIEARGKNLLIHCAPRVAAAGKPDPRDTAQLPVAIWTHLGMTGSWWIRELPARTASNLALVLETDTHVATCSQPKQLALLGPRGLLCNPMLASLGSDLLDPGADLDEAVARLLALYTNFSWVGGFKLLGTEGLASEAISLIEAGERGRVPGHSLDRCQDKNAHSLCCMTLVQPMTQFIIVAGEIPAITLPPGVRLRPIEGCSFAAKTAVRLLSGYQGPLFKIEDQDSGEADRLVDDIHNVYRSGLPARDPALLQLLRTLVNQGRSVACWYGSEVEGVPVFRTWEAFLQALIRDASEQPPEIHAVVMSRVPTPHRGSSE